MPNHVIERELSGADNMSVQDLEKESQPPDPEIRWVRSYVSGNKIYCVYDSLDEEKIREYARGFQANRVFDFERVVEPKRKGGGFWKSLKRRLGLLSTHSSYTKKVFEPKNPKELLRGWLIHSHKGRQRHDQAARQLEHRRNWLGAFAAVLAAVVGGSVFAALEQGASKEWKLTLAMISVLSAVLASLSTFLNLAERAEKHRTAGVQYKAIIRELERGLADAKLAADPEAVEKLEKRLNELEENSPIVPLRLFKKVDDEWTERGMETITRAENFYRP